MNTDLLIGAIDRSVAFGTPILWVAMGEIMVERAGVVNLALDGMMIISALVSFVVAQETQHLTLALGAGMLAGMFIALPHAFASITLRVNQFVTGLALAMLCPGLASLMGRHWVGAALSHPLPSMSLPWLAQIPFLGPAFFTDKCILAYVAPGVAVILLLFLFCTRWGIIWRSAGESPAAVDACGIPVLLIRYLAVLLGGLFAGIGGAYLSLYYQPAWVESMTGGMGWIALAIVIFSNWNPLYAVAGAILFGILYHFSFRLQDQIDPHVLKTLPYLSVVLVLVAGALRNRNGTAPMALGNPYFREDR